MLDGQGVVGQWAARTAGVWGNNLKVSVCESAEAYEKQAATTLNDASTAVGDTTVTVTERNSVFCWRHYIIFNYSSY
jgi:hypothetical protein